MAKSRATVRRGLPRGGLVPLGMLAAMAVVPLCRADGIPLGKFQFYPSFSVGVVQDENLFNQNEDVGAGRVSDRTLELEAPLLLQLPFRASLWELVYTPGLKRFQDNKVLDGDTHRLSTELDLVFSTGSRLNMQGSYTRDYSNLQQVTEQTSESEFTFIDYSILHAHVEFEHPFGRHHGMQVDFDFESLNFDDTDLGAFTDFSELELKLSYVRLLGRDMRLFVGGVSGSSDLDQPSRITSDCRLDPNDCLSPDALVFRDEEREDHWTRVGAQVGFERQFDAKNRARLDIGYQVLEFDHSNDSGFSGLVARLQFSRRFSETLSVSGDASRQPIQSFFDVNNYFVMQAVTASVHFEPRGTSLYYFGSLAFQINAYPDETQLEVNREFDGPPQCLTTGVPNDGFDDPCLGDGFRRRDKIGSVDVGVGMRFSDLMSLDFTVSARKRDSNLIPTEREFFENFASVPMVRVTDRSLDRLGYDDLTIGLTFRYGFIPQRNYI